MSSPRQYLLGLYIVEHQEAPPVSPGRVAEALDRTPGTAVEMFHRLDDEGLVAYEPYEGVALTDAGREVAADCHEAYVTLSWFFRHVLDLDDHEAEAMELVGTVSPEVVERLAWLLPHGEGEPPSEAAAPLDDAALPGEDD